MKKDKFIERYGEDAYREHLERVKKYNREHREEKIKYNRKYYREHPEHFRKYHQEHPEHFRKYHQEHRDEIAEYIRKYARKYIGAEADSDSIPHKRHLIRARDNKRYNPIRQFWSKLETDIHHEWIPNTADYTFIALVERSKHRYGIIDPICILEGEVSVDLDAEIDE